MTATPKKNLIVAGMTAARRDTERSGTNVVTEWLVPLLDKGSFRIRDSVALPDAPPLTENSFLLAGLNGRALNAGGWRRGTQANKARGCLERPPMFLCAKLCAAPTRPRGTYYNA
jgi:hypothetical protein